MGIAVVASALFAPSALASQLVARNAKYPSIAVAIRPNGKEVASVAYLQGGVWNRVLVWGATNAVTPRPSGDQVHFAMSYSGHTPNVTWKWVKKHNACKPYTGPSLSWGVANPGGRWECNVTKGGVTSYWALQVWQRELPDGGQPANARQRSYELQVSHWTGKLPVIWLKWDWFNSSGNHFDHLYGRLSYGGSGVYGYGSTNVGNPTDSFGRNIYVDTRSPPWSTGYRQSGDWYRWNGFLAKRPLGNFCAGVWNNQYGRSVAGTGTMYRATAMGPGVTPIVMWQGGPPGQYTTGFPSGYSFNFPSTSRASNSFQREGFSNSVEDNLRNEERQFTNQAPAGSHSATCNPDNT
ncbi:MAG TPA: hypothetical protein VFW18_00295 [Gaiellales bacterium]|nr:hypothetical protein [Gaiellales bacterium]